MKIERYRDKANGAAKAHSNVVGGSTAKIRRLCNASRIEEAKSPRTSNYAADRGTSLHHVVEQTLKDNLAKSAIRKQFTGTAIKLDDMEHTVDITHELIDTKVMPAVAFFDATVPLDAEVHYEAKVTFTWRDTAYKDVRTFPEIDGAHGTGDVIFNTEDRSGLIDWKFGDGVMVPAEDNDQMRFYLVGAIMSGVLPPRDEYEAWIFQPAKGREPDQYASKGVYTWDDLRLFAHDLYDAVTGPIVYNPGEHCSKCNGRLTCRPYQEMLTTAVKTDVEGLSAQQVAKFLDLLPAIDTFAKAVQEAALRNAQAGVHIPGWKLEVSLGNRAWKDEKAAAGALGRLGLDHKERIVTSVISAPQALAKLKKLGIPEKQLERFTTTHVVRHETGEKLVKAAPGEVTGGALERLGKALAARGV